MLSFLFEQFTCFTSTEVQILTPDEVRTRCCISVVGAAEIASFQTVNISVSFLYKYVGILEIRGRCSSAVSAQIAALVCCYVLGIRRGIIRGRCSCAVCAQVAALSRRYVLGMMRGIIRDTCLLLSCAERCLTGSSSCTPRACWDASYLRLYLIVSFVFFIV